nr:response regulator [Anabaena lutea]
MIQEALKTSTLPHQVVTVRDGIDAMAYLRQEGEYADAPRPDLILLDLNLPRKDGREVLAEIKSDPKLKRIPVVVLTTSKNEDDIYHSYDLHVNCYITKSRNLSQLFQIVKGIEEFWFSTATLPLE